MYESSNQFVLDALYKVKRQNDKIINDLEESNSVSREVLIGALKNSNDAINDGIISINNFIVREIIFSYNRN